MNTRKQYKLIDASKLPTPGLTACDSCVFCPDFDDPDDGCRNDYSVVEGCTTAAYRQGINVTWAAYVEVTVSPEEQATFEHDLFISPDAPRGEQQ